MSEAKQGDVKALLDRACGIHDTVRRERDDARSELARCMRDIGDIGDIGDELRGVEVDRNEQPLGVAIEARQLWNDHAALLIERDQLKYELASLPSEREPRDNGDGTETRLLPVTYPKGLPVECVRVPKRGETFLNAGGFVVELVASEPFESVQPRLILRPAPQPPETVTWEAPLLDGEWQTNEFMFRRVDGVIFDWPFAMSAFRGLSKPAKLGRYKFVNGVGTLIEAAQ